jgi:hypothetical protein
MKWKRQGQIPAFTLGSLRSYLAESLELLSGCSLLSSWSCADCFKGEAIFAPDWANADFAAVGATPADTQTENAENAADSMSAISFFMAASVFPNQERMPNRGISPVRKALARIRSFPRGVKLTGLREIAECLRSRSKKQGRE